MTKKRKKKKSNGYDPAYWNKKYLESLKEGRYVGEHKYTKPYMSIRYHPSRYRKSYVPKWIRKIKDKWLQSDYIQFHKKHNRFPNNEERIMSRVKGNVKYSVNEIAKDTAIDYRNISRYLKKMEKKKLITLEPDYKFKTMKSGRLREYHTKRVRLTKKGTNLYNKLFGRDN